MKEHAVLSCPLCHKIADLYYPSETGYLMAFPQGKGCVSIRCRKCGVEVTEFLKNGDTYDDGVTRLMRKWNSIKR